MRLTKAYLRAEKKKITEALFAMKTESREQLIR
jgi:hypothetical protein